DLKLQVFRDLDARAAPATILASNTSGFPITALAAVTNRPDRVIGWHWASPPPIMRLAEIVAAPKTSQDTIARVCELAQRVVDEGIASREDVNQLMVDTFNWPVGPFAMIRGATEGWKE